jgi:predicted RNA-binding Zn-ribbon protein involved in translation (DUF1610 family)
MWIARPFNSDIPDPFGKNNDRSSEGVLSAESVKCPSCASNIFFQPEVQGMVCRNCGNIYNPSTLEKMGSLGYTIEHDYTSDSELSEDDKKRHEIICDSCGATLIADEHMMSTMCPFCGSPAIITGRLTREFKPDYIVPFKIDRKTAENNIKKWIKSRKMTPMGFKSKSRLTKMTAFYVPFWILDCGVNTDMYGTGKNIKGEMTTVYSVRATATYYVKGVPFDASLKIANKLMEAIEPFDYSEMVEFDNKYLQGFFADKYDQHPTEMMERFIKRMDRISMDMNDTISARYDEYEPNTTKNFTWMSELNIKYCLLPVWFMTVEFDGRNYQLAVNGQTGEASGQAPTTSAIDKLDGLIRFTRSKWRNVPAYAAAVVIPVLIFLVTFSFNTNTFFYVSLCVLGFIEFLLIIFLAFLYIVSSAADHASNKIHKTVDSVNDFDKAPGMDSYLDTTRGTKLSVDEYNYRHELEQEDEKKRNF